ncbi:MAG: type II toxin-antitoxin system VapC family toxin [Gemmatimonadales bacterium]
MTAIRDVVLDTGPIVAALDTSDQWHRACSEALRRVLARCVTTEAVLTEACHFIERGRGRAAIALEFILDADVPVLPLDHAALRHAAFLMDRYRDVPMDFADASLVVVAEALGAKRVLTIDRRGFSAYRLARGAPFELLP